MLLSAASLALSAVPAGEAIPHIDRDEGERPRSHIRAPVAMEEAQGPILIEVSYTGEIMGNVAGGTRQDARYLDNLDLVLEADLDRLAGWRGARFHIYGLYNNGGSISALAGDAQAVSNIETGVAALRLYEAWIDQRIGDKASVKIGLYDLNSEFDVLDAAGLFVSSPHGIGTDFAQSGRNGPSIFPSTSLAARVQISPAEGWAIRAAILDGVPANPDRPRRTAIHLGDGDGALFVGEVEAPLGDGKLLVGHWRYSAAFEFNGGGGSGNGNAGTYIRTEFPLSAAKGRRVDVFGRLGQASGRFNMFRHFVSGGLRFGGWIPGREDDEFGLAVAAALTSDAYRQSTGAKAGETAVEATYRTRLNRWLWLQPSLHYVRSPSAARSVDDALVAGLRFEVHFGR